MPETLFDLKWNMTQIIKVPDFVLKELLQINFSQSRVIVFPSILEI